ncbi:MAG: hypothetical protein WEB30_13360 [Cyclobacteriaceae bacterium]
MSSHRCIFTSFLLVATSIGTWAQRGGINIEDHLLIREAIHYRSEPQQEQYEGSPFHRDTFELGYVYAGKEKFNPVSLRYNIVEDVMEFQHHGQIYLLDADARITRIEIGQEVFLARNFPLAKKEGGGFLELVEAGKLKLLSKKVVNYRKAVPLQGLPAKYSRQPDIFYVQVDDFPLSKVSSVKNLIASLPDKRQEMLQFSKTEKISARDRNDLLKLVRFYNSL